MNILDVNFSDMGQRLQRKQVTQTLQMTLQYSLPHVVKNRLQIKCKKKKVLMAMDVEVVFAAWSPLTRSNRKILDQGSSPTLTDHRLRN